MSDINPKPLLEWDERDYIKVLEGMMWPAQRGDTMSYTHICMNMSIHAATNALRNQWLAKHRLKEDK